MPPASEVVPGAWSEIIILYDDGNYSAMWGRFRGNTHKDLGVRWNGSDNMGFPNSRGHPQWYVEPPFLHEGLLWSIRKRLEGAENTSVNRLHLSNLDTAFTESRLQSGKT